MSEIGRTFRIGVFYRREGLGVGLHQGANRYCRETRRLHYTRYNDLSPQTAESIRGEKLEGIIAFLPTPEFAGIYVPPDVAVVNVANRHLHMDVPSVVVNNERVGLLAAEHLLRTGIRNMACRTILDHQGLQVRATAFRERVLAAGCSCSLLPPDFAPLRSTPESEARDVQRLLALPRPLAILAANDGEAEAILRLAQVARLKVPADLAILGADNGVEVCEHTRPTLSSIDLDPERIGYEAARLLDCLLNRRPLPSRAVIVSPTGVVGRESTNVLAFEDADIVDALRFIREHAFDTLTITQIADHCNLSRRTLERRFRDQLGHSIHDEILALRMTRAEELLRTSNLPLGEIARLCGFHSQAYFTRAVHQKFGRPPSAIRSQAPHPSATV